MSSVKRVKPEDLARLAEGAVVIDVREPGEFAGERWPGSVNVPLSRFDSSTAELPKTKPVVVLCYSGRRSHEAALRLLALGFQDVRVVEGGLAGCGGRGTERGAGGAWAMERQVRLAAGALVLLGAALGWLVHPAGWLLSAGVGAGLVFSAVTDTCGMAAVLSRMPWNRRCR